MKLTEIKQDLFDVSSSYHFAHCVSSDYALGAGIAVAFESRFGLRKILSEKGSRTYPDCIQVGRVFNLVTKERYWNKPTYESLKRSLLMMKETVVRNGISCLAMPRIGSGLDKLAWNRVKDIISEVFIDTDVEILVCYI